jgi:hypothetical protein
MRWTTFIVLIVLVLVTCDRWPYPAWYAVPICPQVAAGLDHLDDDGGCREVLLAVLPGRAVPTVLRSDLVGGGLCVTRCS